MGNFKIKKSIICGSIVLFIVLIENLIIGNGFIAAFFRSIISGIFTFGLSFGLIFLVSKIKNDITESDKTNNSSEGENNGKDVGTNVDYLVDDNVSGGSNSDNIEYGNALSAGDKEETPYSFENFDSDTDTDTNSEDISDIEDKGSNTGFYSKPSNSEKAKEILDSNISEDDMARAIRTVLKRDQ